MESPARTTPISIGLNTLVWISNPVMKKLVFMFIILSCASAPVAGCLASINPPVTIQWILFR